MGNALRHAHASDDVLVQRMQAGSEEAFEAAYDRYGRAILGFCRHMLGSLDEAEDAVQQTFVSAWRALANGGEREVALRPWLYAIARNRCISMLRARRDVLEEPPERGGDDLSELAERRSELRDVLHDLGRLPEDQRASLLLSEVGDLSHAEISKVLGCEVPRVKALVFRARSSLIARRDARDASCEEIREQLATLRGPALRRAEISLHLEECEGCVAYRDAVKRQRALFAAALPVAPALHLKSSVMSAAGIGTTAAAGAGGVAAGGATAAGGAAVAASGAAAAGGVGSALIAKVAVIGMLAGSGALAGTTLAEDVVGSKVQGGVASTVLQAVNDGDPDTTPPGALGVGPNTPGPAPQANAHARDNASGGKGGALGDGRGAERRSDKAGGDHGRTNAAEKRGQGQDRGGARRAGETPAGGRRADREARVKGGSAPRGGTDARDRSKARRQDSVGTAPEAGATKPKAERIVPEQPSRPEAPVKPVKTAKPAPAVAEPEAGEAVETVAPEEPAAPAVPAE